MANNQIKCTKNNVTSYTSVSNTYVLVELLKLGYTLQLANAYTYYVPQIIQL